MEQNNNPCSLPVERIFCIGRNYAEHARELGNATPEKPVVFMKPHSCIVAPGEEIRFPRHGKELHHEVEVVVQIGREGVVASDNDALSFVNAFTVGLDLTLRDVQNELKAKSLPWEKAKSFEQSAPLGTLFPCNEHTNLRDFSFSCRVNNVIRQTGNTRDMIFPIPRLLREISGIWVFKPGDLIYTGTPSGVGPLHAGDTIEISSGLTGSFSWTIVK